MEEKRLARVQNKSITDRDLDRIIEKYPVEKRIYFETMAGRKQLLEQKIAFTLFGLYGEETGKDKEEHFVKHLQDLKEQILTQMIIQELFAGVTVTDEEARQFYQKHPERFVLEETVRARHILTDTEETAKQIFLEVTEKEMDFAHAAEKYSKCPSKEKGGDLGYFKRGMMVKEFEDEAFSLPLHVVSDPVKTQFGYHIIEVMDRTEKGMISYEEAEEKLKEQMKAEKQQKIYEKKIEELKERYHLELFSE